MRDDLSLKGENCAESLFIEIHRPYTILPTSVQDYFGSMDQLITKISRENKNCYLMSDFNLILT